jgi:hypothetical protein
MKTVLFKLIAFIALLIVWAVGDLPLPIMGGIFISIVVSYDLFAISNRLTIISKIGFIALITAGIAISLLFYYKYYITDIQITFYHIIGLILPPIFLIGIGKKPKER